MIVGSCFDEVNTHDLEHLPGNDIPRFRCVTCGRDDAAVGWGDLLQPCTGESKEHADERMEEKRRRGQS